MKTSEEFNALNTEFRTIQKELAELSGEELSRINGGKLDYDLPETEILVLDPPGRAIAPMANYEPPFLQL